MKLIVTPPNKIINRCHAGFDLNSHSFGSESVCSVSKLSSTIPEILTYPPNGKAPTPNSVSPIFFLNNANGQSKNK